MFGIGIGSSGGGVEALRELLPHLPGGDVCYIIAQHMSPTHPSMLVPTLARESNLRVVEAEDGADLVPETVYVAPPNRDIVVRDGRLHTAQAESRISPQPSIDLLFESIAAAFKERSIGVILSGSGSDGLVGATAIDNANGIILAQDPLSARYPSMPSNVIDHGLASSVGDFLSIGAAIASVISGEGIPNPSGRFGTDAVMTSLAAECRRHIGWDLSSYKDGTLGRQMARRMHQLELETKNEYLDYVRDNPSELVDLRDSVLIGVTGFFRDGKPWEVLQESLRTLVASKKNGDTIRAWVPGCASGEEAYSLAIMLNETAHDLAKNLSVKVFATDISEAALAQARSGTYPISKLEDVPEKWRKRYFQESQDRIVVDKHLREDLVVALHDLTRDPPLVRMDVVLCRNLLIYLIPEVQERVFASLHAAMNPRGLLMLGRSESVPADSAMFSTVNANSRIYERVPGSRPALYVGTPNLGTPLGSYSLTLGHNKVRDHLRDAARDRLLIEFGPPSVILDSSGTPIHMVGDTSKYLTSPDGDSDVTITSIIRPELRTEATTLLTRVQRGAAPTAGHVVVVHDDAGESETLRLEAARLLVPGSADPYVILSFVPIQMTGGSEAAGPRRVVPPAEGQDPESPEYLHQRLVDTQNELEGTREHLQAVIEELESSNEELQSMNEEVQASSEELQATNEELETTNEELQATNEELTTVNETLEVRTSELSEANIVLSNIQNAVATAILLVDNRQRVIRYTPMAVRIFGLVDSDLGKPLVSLPSHIDLDEVTSMVSRVLSSGKEELREVASSTATFLVQVRPYVNEEQVEGAVLAIDDITALANARQEASQHAESLRLMAETLPQVVYRTRAGGVGYEYLAPTVETLFAGHDSGELIQRDPSILDQLVVPEDRVRVQQGRLSTDPESEIDFDIVRLDGEHRTVRDRSRYVVGPDGKASRLGVMFDITDLVLARKRAEIERSRVDAAFAVSGTPMVIVDGAGTVLRGNEAMVALVDTPMKELISASLIDMVAEGDREQLRRAIEVALAEPGSRETTTASIVRSDGHVLVTHETLSLLETAADDPAEAPSKAEILVAIQDFTRLEMLNEVSRREAARFQAIFSGSGTAMFILNSDGFIRQVNPAVSELLGYTAESLIGAHFTSIVDADDVQESVRQFRKLTSGEISSYRQAKRFLTSDGKLMWGKQFSSVMELPYTNGEVLIVDSVADLSDERDREEAALRLAQHDVLTGLLNRSLVIDRLNQALHLASRTKTTVSVITIDLDGFKNVNDVYGHQRGDELLKAFADVLRSVARDTDSIARVGGDEFLLIAQHFSETADRPSSRIAAAILSVWNETSRFLVNDDGSVTLVPEDESDRGGANGPFWSPSVTASIGIAEAPEDGRDVDELLRMSDLAMYSAKNRGGSGFAYYSKRMTDRLAESGALRAEVVEAIDEGLIRPYYQPQVAVRTGEIVGFEVLARWEHPERGLLIPADFIDLISSFRLSERFSSKVLSDARLDRARLHELCPGARLAVNIDADLAFDTQISELVFAALGSDLDGWTIEFTEKTEPREDRAVSDFRRLREAGADLSLDDFGRGFSSIERLQSLDIDEVKIDALFIQSLDDLKTQRIVESISSMITALGARSVAEGVETQEQYRVVEAMGITEVQGFYLAAPMSIDDTLAWLRERKDR